MKIFQKITSLSLAAVFLLSSLGFTINKMICLKSGKEKISFTAIEDCCATKINATKDSCCEDEQNEIQYTHEAFITKSECCDIVNSNFDLSDFQTQQNNYLPTIISFDLFYNPIFHNTTTSQLSSIDVIPDISFSPLYGRDLLSHVSILII